MIKPPWLNEMNRMDRLLRDLEESPARQALRTIEQHRQLLEPAGYRVLRELEESTTTLRKFSEALTAGFSSIIGQYEMLKVMTAVPTRGNMAADLQRALGAFQLPALPAFASYAAQLGSISRSPEAMRQFQDTFAGQLLDAAHGLAEAPEEDVDERAEDLAALFRLHLAKTSGGPVSVEGFLQIVLVLFFYGLSVSGAQQSEERVMKHLSEITAHLQELGTREQANPSPELRLVAAASLRIRSKPSGQSEYIGKLARGSLVRVISREKSWARVEYFDFVEGCTREGWVASRFLRELPDDFWHDAPAPDPRAETQAARERFERHFGEVDLGYATGVDNEGIDAALATEYAGADPSN